MKRAGTTGSARGMALYEEEVSCLWVGSSSGSAEATRGRPLFSLPPKSSSFFIPQSPTWWFMGQVRNVLLLPRSHHGTRRLPILTHPCLGAHFLHTLLLLVLQMRAVAGVSLYRDVRPVRVVTRMEPGYTMNAPTQDSAPVCSSLAGAQCA